MRKIIVMAVLGLAAIFILFTGISLLQKHLQASHQHQASDTFVADVLANKASDSYQFFTTNSQSSLSKDDWTTQVQTLSQVFNGQSAVRQTTSDTGKLRIVTYNVKGSDGNYIFSVILTQEGGSWQIVSFTSKLQA